MASKIRKGDTVAVVAGADLGRQGEVLSVDPTRGKVTVQGINRVYKHMRPSREQPQGGRVQKEMPIDISNVMVVDPETKKPTRVGKKTLEDGTRVRIARRSGAVLDK